MATAGITSRYIAPFAVGREPTPLYRRLNEAALECFERVSDTLRDGAITGDILKAASVIKEHGFTVYDRLMHGVDAKTQNWEARATYIPRNTLHSERIW